MVSMQDTGQQSSISNSDLEGCCVYRTLPQTVFPVSEQDNCIYIMVQPTQIYGSITAANVGTRHACLGNNKLFTTIFI